MSNRVLERSAYLLATGFGSGYLWPAPGTWGSLLGIVVFILALQPASSMVQWAVWAALTLAGTAAAEVVARGAETEDPSIVVIDEISGMWIALIGIAGPVGWILSFFVFRALDIVKPFPARQAEALPGGIGIMADDIVAGIYTQILVRLALTWWGR